MTTMVSPMRCRSGTTSTPIANRAEGLDGPAVAGLASGCIGGQKKAV